MKKLIVLLFLLISSFGISQIKTLHDFSVTDIDGNPFHLKQLKGKKALIVNTASKCGLTPQYEELQELYEQYKDSSFIIIGFPANDFLNQEPGSNSQIKQFCKRNYGVTFPMMAKISVKGDNMHPVYKWLTQKDQNGVMDSKIKWNFQKYLIDANGNLIDVVFPRESPKCDKITNWIENKKE